MKSTKGVKRGSQARESSEGVKKGGRRPTRRSGRSIIRAHAQALEALAEKLGWRGMRGEAAFIFGMALLADRPALEKALDALSERDWRALAEWASGEAVSAHLAHTAAQRSAEAAEGGCMAEWWKAEVERCFAVWKQKELQAAAADAALAATTARLDAIQAQKKRRP